AARPGPVRGSRGDAGRRADAVRAAGRGARGAAGGRPRRGPPPPPVPPGRGRGKRGHVGGPPGGGRPRPPAPAGPGPAPRGAEARRRGLTRSWLSGGRIALLLLLLLIPAGALLPLPHRHGLAWAGGLYFVGFLVTVGVGTSRRRSASGQAVLDRWRSAVAAAH